MSKTSTSPAPVGRETTVDDDAAETSEIRSSPTVEPAKRTARVRDVMSRTLPVVDEDAPVDEALRVMGECGVYAVSVRDTHGRVVAMVHESDLAAGSFPARPGGHDPEPG